MEKWKWRIDTVLGMFSNIVVGMALTQFIILFVSGYMDRWIDLNSRVCMLWSQFFSLGVSASLIFSIGNSLLKYGTCKFIMLR